MKSYKAPFCLLFFFNLFSSVLFVPCLFAAGTSGGDFLNIAVGARPSGMGEAFVAVADETSGMFWNPAGLGFLLSPESQASHSLWLADMAYSYAGYAHPRMSGTYGIGLQSLSGPSLPKFVNGVRSGDFQFSDSAANFLYSKRTSDTSSVGFTLRYIQDQIGTTESALTGDVGYLYRTKGEGFSFGVSGQNLFGSLGADRLPLTARAGMAFKAVLPEHFSDILLSLEAGKAGSDPAYYAAGIEHWGARTLGLRFGYKYIADEKHRQSLDALAPWRAGIGIRIQSLELDYAYQPFAALTAAHRMTLTWRTFGWQALWRTVSAQMKADPTLFSPNKDSAKDSVFFVPQSVEVKDVKTWELRIMDEKRGPVKFFTGKDVLPKIISWEGETEGEGQIPEGKYLYMFIVEGDGNKRAKSAYGELVADMTKPEVSLQASTTAFAPLADASAETAAGALTAGLENSVTFYVSVSDLYGVDQWQLAVFNERRKKVWMYKSSSTAPSQAVWDGRDEYYGAAVPNGTYEARLTAWDMAGNKAIVSLPVRAYLPPKVEVKEVVKEIRVLEEKRGLVVNLSSQVMFPVGKAKLKLEAYRALDEVVHLLQTYQDNEVLIEGYTDSTGKRSKNIDISSERAWAVYSYLVKHGISPSRLKPKGYGPDKPAVSNRTRAGRARNRRVEIIILKKQ